MKESRFLKIAPFHDLLTHFRFFVNLRSNEGIYHTLILFRLAEPDSDSFGEDHMSRKDKGVRQLYAMESTCPHLGADMSHADIEEYDIGIVAVCPWHRYDFNLRTGESVTGMRTCTYAVETRRDERGEEITWLETPEDGSGWRLVELRPVSEEFADPPLPLIDMFGLLPADEAPDEPIVPVKDAPATLMQWAVLILNTPNPMLKVERTRHAVRLFQTGQLKNVGHQALNVPRPPDIPPRHASYMRNIVTPAKAGKKKSRVSMLHALANIEQWAWDIMVRFGPEHRDLPPAFFSDFAKMALDESKHFTLLTSRLAALSPSTPYGSLPVHAGLWDSARATFSSLRARLAIIHLVHEARGLDVNPLTIAKFARAGDEESVKALEVIHADEVTHVTTGHRWFTWLCKRQGVDPVATFREEVRKGFSGELKGPFNTEARERAGMTPAFYERLRGELDMVVSPVEVGPDEGCEEGGKVTVAYERYFIFLLL
ncbi:hypothetical protein K488DRAFT_80382 [Vararia minispora EC-137]|uniref:Uncharacterized protein n=1 Tax=Vararia minispora EC-137 TaxID=1314806 RepID=A0ACB8QBK3_9AGAM|nr:hypothetical protein K488DRAFT_80382 [Vararia minispora EC-137]